MGEEVPLSVLIRTDLPLEKKLQAVSSQPNINFPDRNAVYWDRYCNIKQWIADNYYQSAGAGLALSGERYTRHDITHVDDVIVTAGILLGLGTANSVAESLRPYELYVLLFAILLHDAGNARQREQHEKAPKAIIAAMGALAGLEPVERRLISSIAEAHGGRTSDGDKDTIRKLITSDEEMLPDQIAVRGRLLAASLRLADELSENPRRADPQALIPPYNPPESAIHNLYCKTIDVHIDYAAKTIRTKYSVTVDQLCEEFVEKKGSRRRILLVDYIASRVEKCDLERRYCARFLGPANYDRLIVELLVYDAADLRVDSVSLELADEGYPKPTKKLIKSRQPLFDGATLRDRHAPVAGVSAP